MTARHRDWQSRLQACLAERWARPFEWGVNDCALFACDCVQACTGIDPAKGIRGTYSTEAGAAKVIKRGKGLGAIAANRLGPEIPPLMAQPGDVGLLNNGGMECLAVCTGAVWHMPAAHGVVAVPMQMALRAWRLPTKEI